MKIFLFVSLTLVLGCKSGTEDFEPLYFPASEELSYRVADLAVALDQENNFQVFQQWCDEPFYTVRVLYHPSDSTKFSDDYTPLIFELARDVKPAIRRVEQWKFWRLQSAGEYNFSNPNSTKPTYTSISATLDLLEKLSTYSISHHEDSTKRKISFSILYNSSWPKNNVKWKMDRVTSGIVKTLTVFEYGSNLFDKADIRATSGGIPVYDSTVDLADVRKTIEWDPPPKKACNDTSFNKKDK